MADRDEYRSKLRTPKKEIKTEFSLFGNSSPSYDFSSYSHFLNTPSPAKTRHHAASEMSSKGSPHKSGYFLRTPSPLKYGKSPRSHTAALKSDLTGTPSPHKAGSGADLFGNRTLLENLPMPEWDEHFLDNFQEDLLFGIGSEDLEGLTKSPLQSPKRGQAFLGNSPYRKSSPAVSPFKSPLLTSSPRHPLESSPSGFMKTPGLNNGRPLTRQRKLFLQSPERQMPSLSGSGNWPMPLPLSSPLDDTESSMYSDEHETTTSIQSISSYLRQLDDEDNEDDYQVMPPIGWTNQTKPSHHKGKSHGKGKGKVSKSKHHKSPARSHTSNSSTVVQKSLQNQSTTETVLNTSGSKKMKIEPQFTLLRPQAEILNSQICLRMTPRTPPNKIKISRDFSQIQTLPSKEQLRIVRNRFRETLNKAVEQVIEKEKEKKASTPTTVNDPALRSALQRPVVVQPNAVPPSAVSYNVHGQTARKPVGKKRGR